MAQRVVRRGADWRSGLPSDHAGTCRSPSRTAPHSFPIRAENPSASKVVPLVNGAESGLKPDSRREPVDQSTLRGGTAVSLPRWPRLQATYAAQSEKAVCPGGALGTPNKFMFII